MYSPTTYANPSQRAQQLSHELIAVVMQRRGHDPEFGVPDALVALELTKAALLSQAGALPARAQHLVIGTMLVIAVVGGFPFFQMAR